MSSSSPMITVAVLATLVIVPGTKAMMRCSR